MKKVIILIPTFNEKGNIKELILKILFLNYPNLYILVVDDNSPDGTAKIVENLTKKFVNIHLILKLKREGRGAASLTGLNYARDTGAEFLIEMDADFSHPHSLIPELIDTIHKENLDAVFASRLIKGGEDERGFLRKMITLFSNYYLRFIFWTNIKDCTSGFRAYRVSSLDGLNFETTESRDPSILAEYLYHLLKNKAKIKEISFTFKNRKKGESKLGIKQLIKGLWFPFRLKFRK